MKFLVIVLFLAVSLSLFGQEKQEPPKQTDEKKDITTAAEYVEQAGIESEAGESAAPGEYMYNPRGRRDPFWDLLMGKLTKPQHEGKEGLAGLEIEQLELEGIMRFKNDFIALFKGPDGKPYEAKVGQAVFDGEIIKIDANSVVFKKLLTVTVMGNKEKTIIIRLNPEEEKENDNEDDENEDQIEN